ncbi:alpha-1,3-mannosyltransferase ALG3 isoform d [Salpingoeca rosetta]|uniref:dolichyl-P-Man:Man5GlcNAc2-PP-dolichol alpha-1,3-mannosyltransferase n=1 Tax=Salpingoeca rosetta (strain ATCC 50818 / BSB-021) TaxID=946362 RepID=F2U0U1_SALR5|nr:alpha-1,3-mannosyltransferase ALG3 isoform d [Salpingoeca rosetta]EGD80515.1 alpha-1,3-mannosyltransferase ALG3 isoform d [Salpingoeca rosetta]|eukprot:XP_004997076.1 alpha-1,3-mannosyltransferase ALG3 isoform d [Salpingoeca rosetta]
MLSGVVGFARETLTDWRVSWRMATLVFAAEIALLWAIIHFVSYTEIDWKAYMDEVEGFLNGTHDYTQLKGDTGPLVYPAGFVYIFAGLYHVTGQGADILLAQYIFAGVYLAFLALVMYLYIATKQPPYLLAVIALTAFRVHSIFVLRLFNDPVAMLFFYAACALFVKYKWTAGCVLFSLAVSIKMNVLLFAPGLLLLLLLHCGFAGAFWRIALCGLIQCVALAVPFLLENPIGYIVRSFNLGRQFMYVWTVNWRFLPEETFLDRRFHAGLLLLHIALLSALAYKWSRSVVLSARHILAHEVVAVVVACILLTLFASNLVGMAVARSLHYQFYIWYYHSIAWLLWNSKLPFLLRSCAVLVGIEFAWNTYPSTDISSAVLHVCHFIMIIAVFTATTPTPHKIKSA